MKPLIKRGVYCVVLVLIASLIGISPILTNTVYGARVVTGGINRNTALLDVMGPLSPEAWDGISVGGYTLQPSVVQGGDIDLYISTDNATYTLKVYREGATRTLVHTTPSLSGTMYLCTDGYLYPGCGWPVAYSLHVDASWPSGAYTVDIPTTVKGKQRMIFWVRENAPTSTSQILFLSSINTYQAYTNFGGKSFFDYNSSDNVRSPKLTFNRPFREGWGNWDLEALFAAWAENEGYPLEYATTYDLQHIPGLLDPYQVVVIAGHSEFWSWDMRQRLKAFVQGGGRLINLSGNVMWWQVRFEDGDRTIVNYQDPLSDPVTTPQGVTSLPWDFPILDIESTITGVHWRAGGNYGAASSDPTFKHEDGYGGYWVQKSDHWVFEGTGISNGEVFGRLDTPSDVLGDLSDGTTFNCDTDGNTILGPLANMGTPSNFTILGIAPVARNSGTDLGFATMGIYTVPGGGAVFAGSTTGWVTALSTDPKVAQVTRNVLDHFLAGDFPAEPESSLDTEYFFIDRFNCNNLDHTGVLPSYTGPSWYEGVPTHNYIVWTGDVSKARYTSACGIGGGSGLEVTIPALTDPPFLYESQIKTNWQTTDVLYTRVYLDFSNLVMANYDQFILMKYIHEEQTSHATQADLRVRRLNDQFSIRFHDLPTDEGAWIDVPGDRPFMLETKWDKPNGQMWMWIDGTRYDLSIDLSTRPELNRFDLVLNNLEATTTGQLCLDELALANRRIGAGLLPLLKIYMPILQN